MAFRRQESAADAQTMLVTLSQTDQLEILPANSSILANAVVIAFESLFPWVDLATVPANSSSTLFVPACAAVVLPRTAPCMAEAILYSFRLSAPNATVKAPTSQSLPYLNMTLAPPTVTSITNRTISISWAVPAACSPFQCDVIGYDVQILYSTVGNGQLLQYFMNGKGTINNVLASVSLPPTSRSFSLTCTSANQSDCLTSYTVYNVIVTARASVTAARNSIFVLSAEGVPSHPPTNLMLNPISAQDSTSSYIVTGFSLPLPGEGVVTQFYAELIDIEYNTTTPSFRSPNYYCPNGDRSLCVAVMRVLSLSPYVLYSVRVAVQTSLGRSPLSTSLPFRSLDDLPAGVPRPALAMSSDPSEAVLSWDPPVGRPRCVVLGYIVTGGVPDSNTALPGTVLATLAGNASNVSLPLTVVNQYINTLRVQPVARLGAGAISASASVDDDVATALAALEAASSSTNGLSSGQIAGIGAGLGVLVLLLILLVVWAVIRARRRGGFAFPPADGWDVDRSRVRVMGVMARGDNVTINEGRLVTMSGSPADRVAVKILEKGATPTMRQRLIEEAAIMKALSVPPVSENVVKLMGTCLTNDPMMLIMEFLDSSLKDYLRGRRMGKAPTTIELLGMAVNVASGMTTLSAHSIVHRDLAARNCLVTSPLGVKVGVFGFSRDMHTSEYYCQRGEDPIPVRWMAPESMVTHTFNEKSDVFSFGVLVWEIFTLAELPYEDLSNEEVHAQVVQGLRLSCPPRCPPELFAIVQRCWGVTRPSFSALLDELNDLLSRWTLEAQRPKRGKSPTIPEAEAALAVPLEGGNSPPSSHSEGFLGAAALAPLGAVTLADATLQSSNTDPAPASPAAATTPVAMASALPSYMRLDTVNTSPKSSPGSSRAFGEGPLSRHHPYTTLDDLRQSVK